MDGSAVMQALMGLAGGQGAAPGPGQGGDAGAPGPSAATPGMGGGPQQQQVKSADLIQGGMLALFLGLSQMGLQETANEIVQRVQTRLERLQKETQKGRESAALAAVSPGNQPKGVGPMPGLPGM